MYRDNSLGPRCNPRFNRARVDIAISRNVSQHWGGPNMKDGVDRRAKRERRCDYLVATPDPHCCERKMQTGGAGVHCKSKWGVNVVTELPLELRRLRTGS